MTDTALTDPVIVDVFVSYKHEDRDRVAPLVEALVNSGLVVWWDPGIPGGSTWRDEIERHLAVAKCVIVVWSEASVSPSGSFVRDEAGNAQKRGVLLPVAIDDVKIPVGFG